MSQNEADSKSNIYHKIFRGQVKKYMLQKHFDYEELADAAQISTTYLRQVVESNRNPTLTVMDSISSALGVPLELLLSPDDCDPTLAVFQSLTGIDLTKDVLPTTHKRLVKTIQQSLRAKVQ